MTIDRNTVKAISAAIDAALEPVRAQFGLASLKTTGGNIDARNGSAVLKVEVISEGGVNREGAMYNLMREHRGLPPLGTKFKSGGFGDHTIVGMNSVGSKILATRDSDGKTYIFPLAGFADRFKSKAAA